MGNRNFVFIVLVIYELFQGAIISAYVNQTCLENQLNFMGKCFCSPGWETNSKSIAQPRGCKIPVLNVTVVVNNVTDECECHRREFYLLRNESLFHWRGYRCTSLCWWNTDVGTPISHYEQWKSNQQDKQLKFYNTDLQVNQFRHTHMKQRLDEFGTAFDQWKVLNGTDLGDVVEFGAGGYTQLRNIMERIDVSVKHATLVDPLIYKYQSIPGCSYYSGRLRVKGSYYNITLSNLTVENFGIQFKDRQWDTVIIMNVLVYAQNAFDFLLTVYNAVKPGGKLIFHDRWFDDSPVSSKCKMAGYHTNILQVSKKLLDHFISVFPETLYLNTNQTAEQKERSRAWCNNLDSERGFFVVLGKREHIKFDKTEYPAIVAHPHPDPP